MKTICYSGHKKPAEKVPFHQLLNHKVTKPQKSGNSFRWISLKLHFLSSLVAPNKPSPNHMSMRLADWYRSFCDPGWEHMETGQSKHYQVNQAQAAEFNLLSKLIQQHKKKDLWRSLSSGGYGDKRGILYLPTSLFCYWKSEMYWGGNLSIVKLW